MTKATLIKGKHLTGALFTVSETKTQTQKGRQSNKWRDKETHSHRRIHTETEKENRRIQEHKSNGLSL